MAVFRRFRSPSRWSVVSGVSCLAILMAVAGPARAQQSAPAPTKPAASAPKPAAPAKSPASPAAPAAAGEAGQQGTEPAPALVSTPWTKRCDPDPQDKKNVCQTVAEIRTEAGQPIAAVVLIEKDGEAKKLLRGVMPLGMAIQPGVRFIIEGGQPNAGKYTTCIQIGCFADAEANAEFVTRMKKGQNLVIQSVNAQGRQVDLAVPLKDFAKANEGPPVDPKVVEEQQKKLQEEMQRRAEEARKQLMDKQGTAPAAGTLAPAVTPPSTPAPAR